jgi:hypothetical protein
VAGVNVSSEPGPRPEEQGKRSEDDDTDRSELSANISAVSRFKLLGCQISRTRLDRIWKLATDGFSPDAYVSISTTRKSGKIDSEVKAKTLDELLDGIRRATLVGDPDRLDNLELQVTEDSRRVALDFTVSMDPFEDGVSVSVSGYDAEWVQGRSARLRDLLRSTQSPLFMGRGASRVILSGAGLLAAIVGPASFSNPWINEPAGLLLLIVFAFLAGFIGTGFFIGSLIDRRMGTNLILVAAGPLKKVDRISIAGLIVGILGVAATIAALLVAHGDATGHH